ncbi:hypothetical protein BH09MYX1_BH09MYX1_37800 [soil metagenome]
MKPVAHAIMECTGRVGRIVALALRQAGLDVVVVGAGKRPGVPWRFLGSRYVSLAHPRATRHLLLADVRGIFVGPQSAYLDGQMDDEGHAEETFRIIEDCTAIDRVVVLSSIGAHRIGTGIIERASALESRLSWLLVPTVFVRPAFFHEHWARPLETALRTGVLPSVVSPTTRPIPMVAIVDVADAIVRLLVDDAIDRDILELEGAPRLSGDDIAKALSEVTRRAIRAVPMIDADVARFMRADASSRLLHSRWRVMLAAFGDGAIDFEDPPTVVTCPTRFLDMTRSVALKKAYGRVRHR